MASLHIFCLFIFAMVSYLPSANSKQPQLPCDFSSNLCDWKNLGTKKQLDDFNWKFGRAARNNVLNGQLTDHTRKRGGFAYIKTTLTNRTAVLQSPNIPSSNGKCFSFWYHMNGSNVGHLAVKMMPRRGKEMRAAVWQLQGHQTAQWNFAQVRLPAMRNAYVMFEAFDLESGTDGNIAIDDIDVFTSTRRAPCRLIPFKARPGYSPPSRRRTIPVPPFTRHWPVTRPVTTQATTRATTTTTMPTTTTIPTTTAESTTRSTSTTIQPTTTQQPETTTTQQTTTTELTTVASTTTPTTTTTTIQPTTTTELTTTTLPQTTTTILTTTSTEPQNEPTTLTTTSKTTTQQQQQSTTALNDVTTAAPPTTTTQKIIAQPPGNYTKTSDTNKNTKQTTKSATNKRLMIGAAVLLPILVVFLLCFMVRRRRMTKLNKLVNLDDDFNGAMDMTNVYKTQQQQNDNTSYTKLTDNDDL